LERFKVERLKKKRDERVFSCSALPKTKRRIYAEFAESAEGTEKAGRVASGWRLTFMDWASEKAPAGSRRYETKPEILASAGAGL
jgi:hypothetical protein